ncbi:MAG: HD domain-containing protein [Anaerolineae bacterium]|nr:MAG: HD domain-containing protein [Anaerolineae bacterium]
MSEELMELIPEFRLIQDRDLRQRTLAVWQEAMEIGGWSADDLRRMPYTLLVEGVDIPFPQHVSVVCRLCVAMLDILLEDYGDRYEIDRDTLIAGALLADVGKLIEFREQDGEYQWASMYKYLRHPFTGVGLCFKHDIPEAVMHVVATHSWEGDKFKRRPESIIFHHADFTDFDLTKFASS